SNRSTSSWRRCTRRQAAGISCSPRAHPRSSWSIATGRKPRAAIISRPIAITGCRRRRGWRRPPSLCSPSRGPPIPTAPPETPAPAARARNLALCGVIGLPAPPRKEAIEAVKECHAGGIRVTMITGDHKITAAAIAKMLGIGDGTTAITGAEIEKADTATLQERVRDCDVFARASPEHKLRLLKALKAHPPLPP